MRAVGVDARKEEDVINLVHKIEHDIGPVEVLIFQSLPTADRNPASLVIVWP
jgi:hypothetical protein